MKLDIMPHWIIWDQQECALIPFQNVNKELGGIYYNKKVIWNLQAPQWHNRNAFSQKFDPRQYHSAGH